MVIPLPIIYNEIHTIVTEHLLLDCFCDDTATASCTNCRHSLDDYCGGGGLLQEFLPVTHQMGVSSHKICMGKIWREIMRGV